MIILYFLPWGRPSLARPRRTSTLGCPPAPSESPSSGHPPGETKNAAGCSPAASLVSGLATGRRFVRPWLLGSAHRSPRADGGKVKVRPPARGHAFPSPAHRPTPPSAKVGTTLRIRLVSVKPFRVGPRPALPGPAAVQPAHEPVPVVVKGQRDGGADGADEDH